VLPPSVNVERVDAAGVAVITGREDIANARITFTNGLVANLTASRVSRERLRRIRLFSAERSYLSLDLLNRTGEIVRLTGDPRAYLAEGQLPSMTSLLEEKRVGPFPDANPLADQLGAFADACERRSPPLVDAAAATRALRLALEVQREVQASLRRLSGRSS
jgi:predicted dehydrogenase